jgi:hypothetical protein
MRLFSMMAEERGELRDACTAALARQTRGACERGDARSE